MHRSGVSISICFQHSCCDTATRVCDSLPRVQSVLLGGLKCVFPPTHVLHTRAEARGTTVYDSFPRIWSILQNMTVYDDFPRVWSMVHIGTGGLCERLFSSRKRSYDVPELEPKPTWCKGFVGQHVLPFCPHLCDSAGTSPFIECMYSQKHRPRRTGIRLHAYVVENRLNATTALFRLMHYLYVCSCTQLLA